MYECTTENASATIWTGTFLDECDNSAIILRHLSFRDEDIQTQSCADIGLVVARPLIIIPPVSYSLLVSSLAIKVSCVKPTVKNMWVAIKLCCQKVLFIVATICLFIY